jgi:hypothetical protein
MSRAGEKQRNSRSLCRSNHFFIANASARRNYCSHAGINEYL